MSSFTSIRASTSQLDLSAKHKLRFNSLKATSLKDIYNDETSSDGYAPANKNSNNNKQRLLLDHCDVTQSPDYRTFLLMRRRPPRFPIDSRTILAILTSQRTNYRQTRSPRKRRVTHNPP
uniref:Uncharacterized protein n=1 Tax=Ciona intestinalis TaxID=7719 RepID=F6U748_CIOIN